MESEKKLQPCPFCGSEDIEKRNHFITCAVCEADGPVKGNKQDAINAWNSRVTISYEKPEEEE